MKNLFFKKLITLLTFVIVLGAIFTACTNKKEEVAKVETKEETKIETKVDKQVEEISEETFTNKEVHDPTSVETKEVKETNKKVVEKTDDELITETLLEHYKKSFDQNNPIKSVGYKMYVVNDDMPGIKKAYGFATYKEYKIDNDKVVFDCGSGATPIAITFSTDGTLKQVDYEVLTDKDVKSEEFKKVFPKEIQERLIKRDKADIDEVYKKQKEMVKKQYKEQTGKELTTDFD